MREPDKVDEEQAADRGKLALQAKGTSYTACAGRLMLQLQPAVGNLIAFAFWHAA